MKNFLRYLLCVLILAALCTAEAVMAADSVSDDPSDSYVRQTAPFEDDEIELWFDHPFRKTFTSDTVSTGKDTYTVYMAKNEKENAQFVLYSDIDKPGMSATVTDFTDADGHTVPTEIMYEMYVTTSNLDTGSLYLSNSTNNIIREGETPDPIVPISSIKTFKLVGGKSQAFLIKAETDENSVPGWYSAQLDIKNSEGQTVKTATVYCHVWDITISDEPTLQTGIFLTNDVSFGGTYEQFYNYLLDNRMNAMDIPGELKSTNPYLTDKRVNSVRVSATGGGNNKNYMDGTWEYTKYADIYDELHSSDIWDEIKGKLYFYTSDEPVAAGVGWTGWNIDNTKSAADSVRYYWPDANIIVPHHENTPYPNYKFTRPLTDYQTWDLKDSNEEMIDSEAVTWWCPMIYGFTPDGELRKAGYSWIRDMDGSLSGTWYSGGAVVRDTYNWDTIYGSFYDRIMSEIAVKRAEGKDYRMWAYCCSICDGYTYCNHLIENTGIQTKLLFWQLFQNDVTGYLYYASNNWSDYGGYVDKTPTGAKTNVGWNTNVVSRGGYQLWGDGILFYGRTQGKVGGVDCIGSVRVEIMRDGIEEYEMLKMLDKEKGSVAAKNIVKQVSDNTVSYVSLPNYVKSGWKTGMDDYDIVAKTRIMLGEELEASLHSHCEHEYGEGVITTPAGCTKAGYKTYTCKKCGAKTKELIPTLHSTGETYEMSTGYRATCTKGGSYYLECRECGYKKLVNEKAHHSDENYFEYREKSDVFHTIICKDCGKELSNSSHVMLTEYTNTCTEDGDIIKYCRYCDRRYSEGTVPAKGHEPTETTASPTCTDDGYTKTVCERCDSVLSEIVVPATGHDYVNGICTVCGEAEPEPEYILGDLNGDSDITSIDANLMKKAIAGSITLDETQSKAADLNGDSDVTSIDANLMTKYIAGAITEF